MVLQERNDGRLIVKALTQNSITPLLHHSIVLTSLLHYFITPFLLLFVHLCPGSYVGEYLKQD